MVARLGCGISCLAGQTRWAAGHCKIVLQAIRRVSVIVRLLHSHAGASGMYGVH